MIISSLFKMLFLGFVPHFEGGGEGSKTLRNGKSCNPKLIFTQITHDILVKVNENALGENFWILKKSSLPPPSKCGTN